MFLKCFDCQGLGFNEKIIRNKKRYFPCLNCWETHNSIFRGKVWIDDTINPVSPPNSPR